ncbi:Alpha/Beta hydrolase protein [Chaetomium strumarium]|uniref:Alpha/Beta hydrolase protein n=1 Tax=Chaetomium strumarium TaxID=1170767 RepID=A0AAJ0GYC7_9PEZI|nr:Alpha/Beta hydrolase protein [Chaetomium strumarium]
MDQQRPSSALETGDGVRLHYSQTGPSSGQQLLFLTGWRQTAAEWRKQVEFFSSAGFRVTTFDWRGHGESDKPEFGYRISRFAADLNDILTRLDLRDLTIIGHSMGCSVTWAWWDQYPDARERIAKLVLVDQPAALVRDPHWTDTQAAQASGIFTPGAVYDLASDMAAQGAPLVRSMFTPLVSESDYEWILSQNRKMSDAHAAALFLDHAFRDWRDVFPRITVPTLVLGGELSIGPPAEMKWIATQIPGAQHYIFTAAEKGSHFMFWEEPERFNSVVKDFLTH